MIVEKEIEFRLRMEKKRMSIKKKIFLVILGVALSLVLLVLGVGAKLYFDISKTADETFESIERPKDAEQKRIEKVNLAKKESFSILLLGIDTGDMGRTEQGRSDTIMVATINPNENRTTLVSIARDTYTEIVGRGTQDKINHAYAFGGTSMTLATVEKLLDIPIDYYVSINMMGLKELVDAVGGIEIKNTLEFTQSNHHFPLGNIHLNGEQALAYSRMRYEDPNGDYGRQERQRKVVMAIVNKALTFSNITKYQTILQAIESNVRTDLTWSDMKKITLDYRSSFGTIQSDQLQGEGFMQDGISYQGISDAELARVRLKLQQELGLK